MKQGLLLLILIGAGISAWSEPSHESGTASTGLSGQVVVYTAASLTQAFTDLGNDFTRRHPGTKVLFNFAGSQQLAQQLALGAQADVFASADAKQMQAAQKAGRIAAGAEHLFAHNRLIAIVSLRPSVPVSTLADLARPGLKIVIAAQAVPVGSYTRIFLDKAAQDPSYGPAYREGVLKNTVSLEENVRAVLTKVVLGDADAGIVYSSDLTAGSASKVRSIAIPDALNTIADYPIAPVSNSRNPAAAKAFIDLVLSPEGQRVLASYGFVPVTAPPSL